MRMTGLPELDPTEPNIFGRIIAAAQQVRKARQASVRSHELIKLQRHAEWLERVRQRDAAFERMALREEDEK
jgi:hypothetical protein